MWTCDAAHGWQSQGSAISVTFAAGERFGTRAQSDGTVGVYRNGTLLGNVAVGTNWDYRASGGTIGLVLDGAGTVLDDFGGGTRSSGSATNTPTNTPTTIPANTPIATPMATPTNTPTSGTSASARVVAYAYDGLQRLTGASENPGTSASYSYDLAGNRTDGGKTYNAANQLIGLTYDNAGNLTNDGTAAYTYDALNRMTVRGSTTYSYNGDGVLVYDGTTRYTQDLASPLSQVLQTTQGGATTQYLYGLNRLAAVAGSTRTWYGTDALGSVRQTLSDTGTPLGGINYDAWGAVESGTVPTFGFTGEVQDAASGLVNLRARWYSTARGTFTSVDPFAGVAETPYSQHAYQYGYSDPVLLTDPSGQVVPVDGPDGSVIPPCTGLTQEQIFLCEYRRAQGGAGAQHGQQDDNSHECIGDPEAIEIRLPLAGRDSAPACLDAPQAQLNPWYGQRKAKAPSIWEMILQGCGILTAAPVPGDDEEESEPTTGVTGSVKPPSGPSIPKNERTTPKGRRLSYHAEPEGDASLVRHGISPAQYDQIDAIIDDPNATRYWQPKNNRLVFTKKGAGGKYGIVVVNQDNEIVTAMRLSNRQWKRWEEIKDGCR